jgi:hypothetical protein
MKKIPIVWKFAIAFSIAMLVFLPAYLFLNQMNERSVTSHLSKISVVFFSYLISFGVFNVVLISFFPYSLNEKQDRKNNDLEDFFFVFCIFGGATLLLVFAILDVFYISTIFFTIITLFINYQHISHCIKVNRTLERDEINRHLKEFGYFIHPKNGYRANETEIYTLVNSSFFFIYFFLFLLCMGYEILWRIGYVLAIVYPMLNLTIVKIWQFADEKTSKKSIQTLKNKLSMKNQEQIKEISGKETRIFNQRENLGFLFFPLSIFVIYRIIKVIMWLTVNNGIECGQTAGAIIFQILTFYALAIGVGYLIHRMFTNRLNELWEQKKMLF